MDAARIDRLRADLAAARFTVDRLDRLWGATAEAALGRGNRVPALRALADSDDSAAVLARLFVLGVDADAASADRALPNLGIEGAIALSLLAVAGDRVAPLVDLRPYSFADSRGAGAWWIASDLGELATRGALRPDHVLGVGGASVTLSGLQFPSETGRVLDLGTGCGIQALHARRRADSVVATDISARALEFARLNAALNEIDGIEFRLGSLYDPVAGERFDRIISNPPFVITPRDAGVTAYEYRDGGLVGDALVAEVVRGAADHLEPGGIVQLLGNWEYRVDADGLDRAAAWAGEVGLDAWIIEREHQDPARYAETWIRDGGTRAGTPEFDAMSAAWLDDFERRGVTGVGFGYLTLRRPEGTRFLRRVERIDAPLGEGASALGAHLESCLSAHDEQAAVDDAAILSRRFAVAGDVTEERSLWPGADDPSVITLRQGGGFGRSIRVSTELAAVVGACDGTLALGAIVAAVAQLLDADRAVLTPVLVAEVRELLVDGILTFA